MSRKSNGLTSIRSYNPCMTIRGYRLTRKDVIPLDFSASSLDGLTGRVSDGFYSTFTTRSGGTRVFGLTSHLKRLYDPARDLRLQPSVDERSLRLRLAELVKPNLPGESRVRLILTGDTGDVYVGIQPFAPPPESVYREGVHVITAEMSRRDPRIKGTDFIAQSADQRKLVKGDVFEILLTHNGGILEGMTSNFYAVEHAVSSGRQRARLSRFHGTLIRRRPLPPRNEKLITAQKGILLGVTRRAVLRLARGEGMSIEFRPPRVDEGFDEAFLTSSSRGVVPVAQIDGRSVGEGKPGDWTKALSQAYQAYVEERSEKISG